MKRLSLRLLGFGSGFAIGFLLFLIYGFIASFFPYHLRQDPDFVSVKPAPVISATLFESPQDILTALKSEDVAVRREMYDRLGLYPGFQANFYDYERDLKYPERATSSRIRYVNLDASLEPAAVITFLKYMSPVAVVMKKGIGGWNIIEVFSPRLEIEDYLYGEWIEFPETVQTGVHEILIRESVTDATHYLRKARLLKLRDGWLKKIWEFVEEDIGPLEGYTGDGWNNVKLRRTARVTCSNTQNGLLYLSSIQGAITFYGPSLESTFWCEADNTIHTYPKPWRKREFYLLQFGTQTGEQKIKGRDFRDRVEEFVWSEKNQVFENNGSLASYPDEIRQQLWNR